MTLKTENRKKVELSVACQIDFLFPQQTDKQLHVLTGGIADIYHG